MTFLHELHHTTIGGDYHDSTELFGTGPVVDNMNIIRNELNKQGFNYGERLNYKAIHTKEGNIIPFNESALTSLKYNSSMGKKAYYILNSATVSINRLSDSKLSLWCLGALFDCCISRDKPFHPLTPPSDLRQYAVENRQEIRISQSLY